MKLEKITNNSIIFIIVIPAILTLFAGFYFPWIGKESPRLEYKINNPVELKNRKLFK